MRRVFVASAVVHVALFALVMRTRMTAPRLVEAPVAIDETTIEMEEAPVAAPAATGGAVAMATETRSVATGGAPRVESAPRVEAPEAPPDTAPYASNATMIVIAPNVGLAAATGGRNPFLMNVPGGGAPSGSAPSASVDPLYVPLEKRAEQSMKDALRARDQSVGLGLEGPVVHALEDATHAGFAPEHGTATFLAVIDSNGLVIDLKVLTSTASGSEGARGWENVRKNAALSLARAKIDMRGVKHAELKIAVQSDVLLPSGNKPTAGAMQAGSGEARPVAVSGAGGGSPSGDVVQTYEVGKFDLSDIGAKGQHVVHARLTMLVTR